MKELQGGAGRSNTLPAARKARRRDNAVVPFELLFSCTKRKGVIFVYAMLQTTESPSIGQLAAACGMSVSDVRVALKWLQSRGWIERIDRIGDTSQFRVFLQRLGAHEG